MIYKLSLLSSCQSRSPELKNAQVSSEETKGNVKACNCPPLPLELESWHFCQEPWNIDIFQQDRDERNYLWGNPMNVSIPEFS